jgi:hypothetical protein
VPWAGGVGLRAKKPKFQVSILFFRKKIEQPSGHPHGIGFPTVMFKNFPLRKTSVMTIEGERGFFGGEEFCQFHINSVKIHIDQKSIIHITSFSCPHFDFLYANDISEKLPVFFPRNMLGLLEIGKMPLSLSIFELSQKFLQI